MTEKVVILGGGIAGLTAAHELIERGFEVHVYERKSVLGGKATSARFGEDRPMNGRRNETPPSGPPIEHGFRFFPGWYRHLPDTLKRIPYQGRRATYQGGTVHDNLLTVDAGLLAWYEREPIPAPMHIPRNAGQTANMLSFVEQLRGLGLEPGEIAFFLRKLAEFMAMSEVDRVRVLEPITWWQYLEAETKSQAFRDLITASTRAMVAAKAEEASAYTIGRLAVRTLFDALSTVDRVLNGPTNEVWIEPWYEHLKSRGVEFHFGYELDSLIFRDGEKSLDRVRVTTQAASDRRRRKRAVKRLQSLRIFFPECARDADDVRRRQERDVLAQARMDIDALTARGSSSRAPDPELRDAAKVSSEIVDTLDPDASTKTRSPGAKTYSRGPGSAAISDELAAKLTKALDVAAKKLASDPDSTNPALEDVPADYFVFALPVEQMAYYVNRSTMLKALDPTIERVVHLARHVDWMSGIQFYLSEPLELARGHIVFMNSEWSLTAIEHAQFWRDTKLPIDVKAVLSVDIAAWDRKGRFVQKEAFECSREEIASEVWQQLKGALNRRSRTLRLRDEMLRDGPNLSVLTSKKGDTKGNYHIDESVADLLDRKKQAAYERARGVWPGQPQGLAPWSTAGDAPYIWGGRAQYNLEPLLVNRAGSRSVRPSAKTGIRNMFLAADYVLTETDLACMEGANEAARQAVNALLDAASSRAERCAIWRFTASDQLASWLTSMDWLPAGMSTAMDAARSFGKLAGGIFGAAGRLAGRTMGSANRQ